MNELLHNALSAITHKLELWTQARDALRLVLASPELGEERRFPTADLDAGVKPVGNRRSDRGKPVGNRRSELADAATKILPPSAGPAGTGPLVGAPAEAERAAGPDQRPGAVNRTARTRRSDTAAQTAAKLPATFTAQQVAKLLGLKDKAAYTAIYRLREQGLAENCGAGVWKNLSPEALAT